MSLDRSSRCFPYNTYEQILQDYHALHPPSTVTTVVPHVSKLNLALDIITLGLF